ncbi:Initiation-control protein yabA [Fructilactobacillus lindneri DSM 20690 = JCM 11027]|uniref:Initiation-control protein yabA n=2 Tax=Fructilactobacillus lindneri TaxID=53444 RepID=A0A0R2JQA5_9LACO|nr:Initiation-control protein yabA [Fructilactobacillus lindneri DSM 20690 = JCM 11027]SJZ69748.1 Regulator of replication initiation timing [Fructilactobacillus lindneri DSM 20690 = JCM 11027]
MKGTTKLNTNKMDEGMDNLTIQFEQMVTKISEMRGKVNTILEENTELKIENEHLRELLNSSKNKNKGVQELSMSKKNLEKLYNQGYHICNQYYGKRRMKNESCIFCTDIIYGER